MSVIELFEKVDELQSRKNFSCKRTDGCRGECCIQSISGIQPTISPEEKILIEKFHNDNNISLPPISIERCRFLTSEMRCSIYSVRPISCRLHFCDNDNYDSLFDADIQKLVSDYFIDNPGEIELSDYLWAIKFNC